MRADDAGSGAAGHELVMVTAAEARYGDLTRGVNPRHSGSPDAVYLASSAAQVAEVVQQAVIRGHRLTVRSGGHCLEDFVFNPQVQVVLDLSGMNRVYFDTARGAIAVEPGATLMDVYTVMDECWGVTIPAGSFYSVGAGGHVAGGGFGFLSRAYGMAADHLYAVQVVVVDSGGVVRTVVATRDDDDPYRDLWWAHTGGGGGNFGVVTRYWFRSPGAVGNDPRTVLPRAPAELLFSHVSIPWRELTRQTFTRLLKNYGAFHEKHKAPDSPYLAVTGGLLLSHRSGGEQVARPVPAAHAGGRVCRSVTGVNEASYLGIDIGATKVSLCAVPGSGDPDDGSAWRALARWPREGDLEWDLAVLRTQVADLRRTPHRRVAGVGAAVAATLDLDGRVVAWPSRSSWAGLDLLGELRSLFPGSRIVWADDGGLAAVAEARATGLADLVYVGVGTGVGGGIVTQGRLVPGISRGACVLGHLIVIRGGALCACGRRGCVQAESSGSCVQQGHDHGWLARVDRWLS